MRVGGGCWGSGGGGCACVDAGRGGSEICNVLLNQVVYCCNVSCIAL